MEKIRVLFVLLQLEAGGSERVVLDIARNLDPSRFKVYVAAFNGGVLEEPMNKVCKEVFLIEKSGGLDLTAMLRLARIVRDKKIAVVNAHHYMPFFYCFLGTKILNRRKLIYTEHSVPEVEGIVSGIHGRFFYWMLFFINGVVGVSNEITQKFKQYYPRHADKFYEIVNGIDTCKFRLKTRRHDIRRCWGFTDDQFVVGVIANFRKVKNHACLVRAIARLAGIYPQLRVIFVGAGFKDDPENSEDEVRELIDDFGLKDKIVFTGYQENIPEILPVLDVFCLPSFSEGLPISILEAMAAGVPVVGSFVRGITEVIANRETGLLFTSDDDSELAAALEEILSSKSLARSLPERASTYVQNRHSKEIWLRKIGGILS